MTTLSRIGLTLLLSLVIPGAVVWAWFTFPMGMLVLYCVAAWIFLAAWVWKMLD